MDISKPPAQIRLFCSVCKEMRNMYFEGTTVDGYIDMYQCGVCNFIIKKIRREGSQS